MPGIDEYRAFARADREAAAEEQLPRRRAMFEASAERWEEMVRQIEETASRAVINDRDRARAKIERDERGIVLGARRAAR